jgi:nitroreductase
MGEDRGVAVGEDAPVLEVMATMRAMRRLKPDPVPDELLERLVEAATWAPSGSNAQAYEFVVVTDRAVMAELAGLWRRSHELYFATVGGDRPATMSEAEFARMRKAIDFQRDHFAETPALIVPCYRFPRKADPRTAAAMARRMGPADFARFAPGAQRMVTITEAASIYPGVQNLLLAARALGLAATLTTWHLFFEQEWKRVLGIPGSVHTYAVIPVGWPRGRFGPVRRRPAREAVHRDRW